MARFAVVKNLKVLDEKGELVVTKAPLIVSGRHKVIMINDRCKIMMNMLNNQVYYRFVGPDRDLYNIEFTYSLF